MSTLNKIYYGSAGTGKTREAVIKAVKIVNEKLNIDFDIDTYMENFKSFSGLKNQEFFASFSKSEKKELYKNIYDANTNEEDIVKSSNNIKMLTNEYAKKDEAKKVIKEYRAYPFIETVTFHPSYSYQDFVEGISVETVEVKTDKETKNEITYKVKDGIFKKICKRARDNEGYNYVLIIDEINRGDISSVFGELFTLLEDSKREGKNEELSINLPYSKDNNTGNPIKLTVPSNLYIVATMNTVDKSIALIDVALRRRFEFIEMKPDYETLSLDVDGINLQKMLEAINDRISILKNEHYQIGHSYFLEDKIKDFNDLKNVMTKNIIPLLQEYFYDDWRSICAVLNQPYDKPVKNEGLFDIKKADEKMFASEFKELIEFNNKKIVTIRAFEKDDIAKIY